MVSLNRQKTSYHPRTWMQRAIRSSAFRRQIGGMPPNGGPTNDFANVLKPRTHLDLNRQFPLCCHGIS
jgi:hypothetical protein